MNKITAVVLTYYPERVVNVKRIIKDLKVGTRKPDEIIVLNNNPEVIFRDDVTTINCSKNYFTRAKYIACLLEPSDFYLLLDDDVTVGTETLAYLESLIPADPVHFCTGPHGVILNGDSFSNGHNRLAREISEPIKTDSIIGNAVFCSFSALLKTLESEINIRLKDKKYLFEADDVLVGLANRPIVIYPAKRPQVFENLSENGVSLQKTNPDYLKMRDDFTKKALDVLGR